MSFLDALHLKNHSGKVPLWMMRQAGRYLPEYREIRKNHSFMEMVKSPEIACEITLQPIRRFQFDAAILFADILLLPDSLGMGLEFKENMGPLFKKPLESLGELKSDISSLTYVREAIGLIKEKLTCPLIGFAGAPFTVLSYMIEGGSSKTFAKTKAWLLEKPETFHELMGFLSEKTIEYLEMQIEAGVDAVQLFDTWAGNLSNSQFREMSLPYITKIITAVKTKVPVILFSKASSAFTEEFKEAGPHGIGFDINADLAKKRERLPGTALQGNLDPDILLGSPETVRKEARKILASMNNDPGFIFNLGHGILPETPIACVEALVDEVRNR